MRPTSPHNVVAAGGCLAVALLLAVPVSSAAQCNASVKPAPGEVGYRKRPYACEGMYVGLQSAPVGVQVVSLVRGTLSYAKDSRGDSVLYIKVRAPTRQLAPRVNVIGRARQANLHWALDGTVHVNGQMRWDLTTVVKPMELDSAKIGVYGLATRQGPDGSLGGPIFVPLEVTRDTAPAYTPESVELIVRIPLASALCWFLGDEVNERAFATSPSCITPIVRPLDGNSDGYFKIAIPAGSEGAHRLAIRWRPRSGQTFGKPVHLSIFFW